MNTDTYFKIFKIKNVKEISMHELKRRYRILVKKYHPDKGGTAKQFNLIQDAYNYILARLIEFIEREQVKFYNKDFLYYSDGSIYDMKQKKWRKFGGKIIGKKINTKV